jgi:ubiquinone/menaquinone biosynthesis C-methylase UbiE
MEKSEYIISGGQAGKSRLNVLSDVLAPYTRSLLEKNGSIVEKSFLDVGCGGGNVSMMVAEMVGYAGHVTGVDADAEILSLAEQEAAELGIKNITFKQSKAEDLDFHNAFDIAYARFLLSHVSDPAAVLSRIIESVKPGGRIVAEDVQFSGHFCYPESEAFDKYINYYTQAAHHNGHNPEIGPALLHLFRQANLQDIGFDVIQPCFSSGTGKMMAWLTLDRIKGTLIKQGIADERSIDALLSQLQKFTEDKHSIISLPRIFRVWGKKG